MESTEIIDGEFSRSSERRRKLLPTWIKVFLWIFMVFGLLVPIALTLGVMGMHVNLSLYGLETTSVLSIPGLLIVSIFAIKGTVSLGLWTEKDWAINLAIIDAIIGIAVCVIVMLILPFLSDSSGFNFSLRFELIVLIPYLIKMKKIKIDWEKRN